MLTSLNRRNTIDCWLNAIGGITLLQRSVRPLYGAGNGGVPVPAAEPVVVQRPALGVGEHDIRR